MNEAKIIRLMKMSESNLQKNGWCEKKKIE